MAQEDDDGPSDLELLKGIVATDEGKTWLTETLKSLGLEIKPPKGPDPSPGPPGTGNAIADFFQGQAARAEKRADLLAEKLESILDLLTPEQRTLLRSPKNAGGGDPPKIPPKQGTGQSSGGKRGFLRKL